MRRRLKRVRWWLEFGAAYTLFMVTRLIPGRLVLSWGRLIGRFGFRVLRIRRTVAIENLTAAFGAEMSPRQIRSLAARFYALLGMTLVEFIRLHDCDLQEIRQRVTIEGLEHLEACRQRGQGALVIAGHFGNWELGGAIMAAAGFPISYLIKSQSNPYVDRLQNEIRRRAGIGVIRQGPSVRRLVYALRRQEFVGILGDQDGGNQGLFMEFMGRTASVFRGPAYIAYRTGCPLVPTAIVRKQGGRHHVIVTPPIAVDPAWTEEEAVYELTLAHTQRLADFIRRYPDHYFWVHRRWKTQPPPAESDQSAGSGGHGVGQSPE